MRTTQITIILFSLLLLMGCSALKTEVAVKSQRVPTTFDGTQDTTSTAAMNWRGYFADPALVALIDTALKNNYDLLIALQRMEVMRADVRAANGARLPQVGLNLGASIRKFGLYTMDGAGNITTEITPGQIVPIDLPDLYTGLSASWEIDIRGKLRNQRKAALANYLASVEGTNYVITNLVADISIAYYELVALDNELETVRQTLVKQQEALEVITAQKEVGRANELAVQQFTAQVLNAQSLEKEVLQRIREAENAINFLLGRFPQPVQRSREVLFDPLPPVTSGVPSQLLQNRPDIREAAMRVEASRFDVKAAKAEFYPNVTLTAGYGYQAFDPQYLYLNPTSMAYSLIGGITAPLINRSAIQAQFNAAKANQITAMYEYQRTVLNGFVEVSNELANLNTLQDMDSLKTRQSEVMQRSVETSGELYRTARAGYLDVLFVQQNALQTQLEVIDIKRRQRMAAVNIYRALGGGWR